ncbi:hypothetical protein ACF0H5_018530 [Mactra antiquata]
MTFDVWDNLDIIGFTLLVFILTLWFVQSTLATWRVKAKIKAKQERCESLIQKLGDSLEDSKRLRYFSSGDRILGMNFKTLQAKLQSGQIKAEQALLAYQTEALEKNQEMNFIVEPVAEAKDIAKARDKDTSKTRKDKPLHGIPISIKENYFLKGYDSTGGLSRLIDKPATKDGVLVKVLKQQGAIPFVKTNIPQSMMTFECSNPIYGTTVNPNNPKRSPGGSSGGEGAIIASGASILGWGSDIGGSIRIPCHFCGVYGLKPTAGRLSLKSSEELCDVHLQTLIKATSGPLGQDVDTLVEAMKAVLCPYHFELDPEVPPLPFDTQIYESTKRLRIGYYVYDGYIPCIPAVERGVLQAKDTLTKMGHTLVPFEVPDVEYMFSFLFCKSCFGDGGDLFREMLDGDIIASSIKQILYLYKCPTFIQIAVSYLANWISKDRVPGEQIRCMQGVSSVRDWWKLAFDLDKYKKEFIAQWKNKELDVIICPTMPYVAAPTDTVKYLICGVTYTALYNALNFPAGVVPVTKVTSEDEANMSSYPSRTGTEKFIKKYFSEDTVNLPVGIQCVGLPYQEELVLRLMKELETGLKEKS